MTFFMTFFEFFLTTREAVTFKNVQTYPCLSVFFTSSHKQSQNSYVHQNECCSRYSINCLYFTLLLLWHLQQLIYKTKLSFSMTFHDRQLNSMTFQAWKTKFVNFMAFHDLYEPCIIRLQLGLFSWVVKRATSLITDSFCSTVAKQVALFLSILVSVA